MIEVMNIKRSKSPKELQRILTNIYLQGFADAQDAIVDDSKRFLHINKDMSYEFICPFCGETSVLDMEDMLNQQEQEGW